jgi:hypothetical protein
MADWGKGVNNDIGWGQGGTNSIGYGSIYAKSNAGLTLLLKDDAFIGLLDAFPNGSFAASPRKLRQNYTGASTEVRIASNAQSNIGFADNELNEPSLVSFADGGDAFTVVFKDQTANGRDFSRSTASEQPKIVSNGSVILANGKPTFFYDGTKYHLRRPAANFCTPTNKLQVSVVAQNSESNIGSNQYIMGQYGSGQDERSWAILIGTDEKIQLNFGNPSNGTFLGAWRSDDAIITQNLQSIGFTYDSGTVVIYVNGSVLAGFLAVSPIPSTLFNSSADVTIGSVLSNNVAVALWNGNISEIYLADNLTDNIIEIQQNQIV